MVARLAGFPSVVRAGATVTGTLVLTNSGGAPVTLSENGCKPRWTVGLRNGSIDAVPAAPANCAPGGVVVPPGESRLPAPVHVTYSHCGGSAPPPCPTAGGMPPLPSGRYDVVVELLTIGVPPRPITVQ